MEVTATPPICNVSISAIPFTLTFPLERTIKSVSALCPIFAPSITILSIVNKPALRELVVPILISPNPDVIEPEFNAPVVTILLLPVFALKLSST